MSSAKNSFNKLKAEWDVKLIESGFKDIEYKDGSIKSCKPRSTRALDPSLRQATQEYYYMCYHFLNEHVFTSELEKVIWEYHTEGISVRNICKLLKTANVATMTRWSVWDTIRRLESIMKLKYLSP